MPDRLYVFPEGTTLRMTVQDKDTFDIEYVSTNGKVVGIDGLEFQSGPIKENGVNGLTNEIILQILVVRISMLDALFPCEENKMARNHMVAALEWLMARTEARIAAGVEGTNQAIPDHEEVAA